MYKLYIGNKNYSSWSLRGWLVDEALRRAVRGSAGPAGRRHAATRPTCRSRRPASCRACTTATIVVWDSLAIAEYLAERHPGMWPADARARARGRARSAREMHSGFSRAAQRDDDVHPRARRRAPVVGGARSATSRASIRDLERIAPALRHRRRLICAARSRSPTASMRRSRSASRRTAWTPDGVARRLSRRAARASVPARVGERRRSRRRRSSMPTSRAILYRDKIARRSTAREAMPATAPSAGPHPRCGGRRPAAAHPRRRHQGLLRRAARRRTARRAAY